MATVTAFEAKTRFGELLERVSKGEEVVITRHDKAVARLVPEGAPRHDEVRRSIKACATSSSGFDDARRPSSRIGRCERPSTTGGRDTGLRRGRRGGYRLGAPGAGYETDGRDAGRHR
jgi:prevent-host-death family protein